MTVAFAALDVLANEPMHPQVLCVALLGAFTLIAVVGPGRRPLWGGGAGGALIAALFLTKPNLGAFAVAAMALAAVLAFEPLRRRRWLARPGRRRDPGDGRDRGRRLAPDLARGRT
jgi:hypothetical protein